MSGDLKLACDLVVISHDLVVISWSLHGDIINGVISWGWDFSWRRMGVKDYHVDGDFFGGKK